MGNCILVLIDPPTLGDGKIENFKIESFLRPLPYIICMYEDLGEAIDKIEDKSISPFVILSTYNDPSKSVHSLSIMRKFYPQIIRVLYSKSINIKYLSQALNEAEIYQLLNEDSAFQKYEEVLNMAHLEFEIQKSRENLLRESTLHLKELEQLTKNLEVVVEERTINIRKAQEEEENRLKKWKSLAHFIFELSQQNTLEDVIQFLRSKSRKFHGIGDPFLIYEIRRAEMHHGKMMKVTHAGTKELTPHSLEVEMKSGPITLPFSLENALPKKMTLNNLKAILYFEVEIKIGTDHPFLLWLNDRLGPLSIAIDRILLEMNLSNYSNRWEKTFDGLNAGICIIDSNYRIVRANKKFAIQTVDKSCYQSFAGREIPCEGCPLELAKSTFQSQLGHVQKNSRFYEVHSYPIHTDIELDITMETPSYFINQYVDTTDSRELYLKMVQLEKMSAIGQLAGNIAHELNNPLTGIRSLAQVLISQIHSDTSLKKDLVEIEKATARSQRIIKSLLDFAKGENKDLQEVVLDEIIEKTFIFMKTLMRSHQVFTSLNTRPIKILVNPSLMQQAIFNLISNACQAMKKPGILEIRTEISKSQSEVLLFIKDTGPGIPENMYDKIFEPFFTTKDEGQGTGLGLSLTKNIIEKFKGSISVESCLNQWTTFIVSIPIYTLETPVHENTHN